MNLPRKGETDRGLSLSFFFITSCLLKIIINLCQKTTLEVGALQEHCICSQWTALKKKDLFFVF